VSRPERSVGELREASIHVVYEIERLFGALHDLWLINCSHQRGDPASLWTHDALLESWTIHLRNTMHFLRGSKPQPSDILAEDYFTRPSWYSVLHEASHVAVEAGLVPPIDESMLDRRINKEIVHLTYDRIEVAADAKFWKLGEITEHIARDLQVFVDTVPQSHVAEGFHDRAQAALRIHPGRDCRSAI
jgi:hypothetical protein